MLPFCYDCFISRISVCLAANKMQNHLVILYSDSSEPFLQRYEIQASTFESHSKTAVKLDLKNSPVSVFSAVHYFCRIQLFFHIHHRCCLWQALRNPAGVGSGMYLGQRVFPPLPLVYNDTLLCSSDVQVTLQALPWLDGMCLLQLFWKDIHNSCCQNVRFLESYDLKQNSGTTKSFLVAWVQT